MSTRDGREMRARDWVLYMVLAVVAGIVGSTILNGGGTGLIVAILAALAVAAAARAWRNR